MSPYFHIRWYVDQQGVLQRRTPEDQARVEAMYDERGIDWWTEGACQSQAGMA